METKKELIEKNKKIINTSANSFQLNYKSKLSNKINSISKLLPEYFKENLTSDYTVPYIIQELQEWLYKAQNTPDETESELQLATIFIKNYLMPIENAASLLLKIALPTIFNTEELEEILKNEIFSQNEQEAFKEIYLKNILETKLPNNLTSGPTFFSLGTNVEIQKKILLNTPSSDLIKATTTNKLFQALNIEILFERYDEIALKFQEKTLENWFKQINNGENPLSELFDSEDVSQWIRRIKGCINRSEMTLTYKVHCIKLLQYLCGNTAEKINTSLVGTMSNLINLNAPQYEIGFNEAFKAIHESQKTTFLTAVTPGAKSTQMIDSILDKIEEDKDKSTQNQRASYTSLISMAANFSEQQLLRAITLCFNKATEAYCYSPNYAVKALFAIIKEAASLPPSIQTLLIEILEELAFAGCQNKDFKDYCAIEVLLQFANTNNPEIFTAISDIIITRINHADKGVQGSATFWINLLVPKLTELPDNLISTAIRALDNERDQNAAGALKAVARQLSDSQLTKYLYQSLSLLNLEKKEDKIRGCKIIGALASNLSPCPNDIILKLVNLAKCSDLAISQAALQSLTSLRPNLLFIKSSVINKVLINDYYGCGYAFNSIIKLASALSSSDISDNLIYNLIDSTVNHYKNEHQLKNKALDSLSKQLNHSQLNTYVDYCLQTKTPKYELTAIPTQLLNGRLEVLFAKYSALLKDKNWNTRSRACDALPAFKTLLPMFPEGFLLDFVNMINDDDYRVSKAVCKALPEILDFVQGEDITKVYEILSKASANETAINSSEIRETACKCLGLLAPKLSQEQVTMAKEILIISLDDQNWTTSLKAFQSLTKIAYRFSVYRFSNEELTSLIDILVGKFDQYTYKYIREIAALIPKESQDKVLQSLFDALEIKCHKTRSEACLTLSSLAPYLSPDFVQQIISKFIVIVKDNNEQDRPAALNGLIMLANVMTSDELNQILNLPPKSLDLIVAQYLLGSLSELQQQALPQDSSSAECKF
jgi:hypothetical protein